MQKSIVRIAVVLTLGWSLSACSWARDTAIDNYTGIPASSVIRDMKRTSDEYEQEQHEKRVEELNEAIEEQQQRNSDLEDEEGEPESIILQKPEDYGT